MGNRYEIAEQNGMSREFVDWFFDNKKAGCGNVWFMMMVAMWEGWQGRAAMLSASPAPVSVSEDFLCMLTGRAKYLRGKGEVKSPELLERAAAMLNHSGDVIEMEAIKQQSTMQPNNGAMSGDAVKQSSSNAQRR